MKRNDDDKTSTGRTQVIRWSEQSTKMTLSKCKLTMTSGEIKGKEFQKHENRKNLLYKPYYLFLL